MSQKQTNKQKPQEHRNKSALKFHKFWYSIQSKQFSISCVWNKIQIDFRIILHAIIVIMT